MRLLLTSLVFLLFFHLSGQENFFTSFGQLDQNSPEACEAIVIAGENNYAVTTKSSPGDKFQLIIYQIAPNTGEFIDSHSVSLDTPRTVVGAAGNAEGEIFIIHKHGWKDYKITLFDSQKKVTQHQPLNIPEGFSFDNLWNATKGRWIISIKANRKGTGSHLLRFEGLALQDDLFLFPEEKVKINDLFSLSDSEQLLVGALRDSAALIWLLEDSVSQVKTYGKATDKYNMELCYNAFRKVLRHDEKGAIITGGYRDMGNEVIVYFNQNYQITWDTLSKGRHPNEVRQLESSDDGNIFYSLSDNILSVADLNLKPFYFHSFKSRAKLPRPDWKINDICLSTDGKVLITSGTTGQPRKDLNFTLTGYSTDLKDTLWHRQIGVKGRNTNYQPEGIAGNKIGTIFTLIRTPADYGHHQLTLQANNKPSEVLWRTAVTRFPEDTPRDAVLHLDSKGDLLVMAGVPGEEASWLYRYSKNGQLLSKAKTLRTSNFSVKPRLKELKDGRLLATMSVPYIREEYDPSSALSNGYAITDYFSRIPCLLTITPDGKHTRIDTLLQLRKGRLSDVVELDNKDLIIVGHSMKPLHAGISRYNLSSRKRTWARSLHRPGFDLSRTRSVTASSKKNHYDVLVEYQRGYGKDIDLMIYRFNDNNQVVDSLLIEHRDRQLVGAEMHQTAKGDLLLRYGLGKPPFDLAKDDHRLRLVLISGKRLKIQATKHYEEFQGTTIPYFSTAYGKKGHAILGTMLVDGKLSMDAFLFGLGAGVH
jgi:hypothetical protein